MDFYDISKVIESLRAKYETLFDINRDNFIEFLDEYIDYDLYETLFKGGSITDNQLKNLINSYETNIEYLKKEIKSTARSMQLYGVSSDNAFYYQFYKPGEYDLIAKLLKSKYRKTAIAIKLKYASRNINIAEYTIGDSYDTKYGDMADEIELNMGAAFSDSMLNMLLSIVITELIYTINTHEAENIIKQTVSEFENAGIGVSLLDKSHINIINTLDSIDGVLLFYAMNTDFSDESLWSNNKILFSKIANNMEKYKISVSTYKKMSLLNIDSIENIDKNTLILIEIARRLFIYASSKC